MCEIYIPSYRPIDDSTVDFDDMREIKISK
jgi:hypothetical protein